MAFAEGIILHSTSGPSWMILLANIADLVGSFLHD